jgi:hypothetical protein
MFSAVHASLRRINWFLCPFFKFEMFKYVASDHVLVETNSCFAFRMQNSVCVNPNLEIGLKLFAQVKVLLRKSVLARVIYLLLNLFPKRQEHLHFFIRRVFVFVVFAFHTRPARAQRRDANQVPPIRIAIQGCRGVHEEKLK